MRNMTLAAAAAAMAVPAAVAVPPLVSTASAAQAYNGPTWRGRDGRLYCRRSNGTTGLIVGGAGGALIGRALDGGRSRATGTIVGAAAGALIGREVQRSRSACRCR